MNLPWKQVSAIEIANLVAARLTSGPARLAMLIIFLLESPVLSQEFTFTTIVGNAGLPGAIDGMNAESSFNSPYGITVDNSSSWSPVEGTTNTTYVIEIEKNSAAFFRLVKRQ